MSDFSDLDRQIEQLKQCEIIKENEVKALCAKAREILVEEGNVQRVDSPVTVSRNHFCEYCNFYLFVGGADRYAATFMDNSTI